MLGAMLVSTLIQLHRHPKVLSQRFHRRLVPGQGFAMTGQNQHVNMLIARIVRCLRVQVAVFARHPQ